MVTSVLSKLFALKPREASSQSKSISLMRIDSLPDSVVEYILSKLSNAKDVASCNCVSKKWKDSMSYRKSLCFPRGIFNNLTGPQTPDSIVMQMASSFSQLQKLDINGATLKESLLKKVLNAIPNLTQLVLYRCEGLLTVCVEHLELRNCQFCLYTGNSCSFTLKAPKIQYLVVEGCDRIRVDNTNCLKTLSIGYIANTINMVELGDNLMALESLTVIGFRWHSEAISKILRLATQVKHLLVKIPRTNDLPLSNPFPEIDFVEFFKTRPKLKSLHIHGAMSEALCNNHATSIKNVDSSFVIPCLEEVVFTPITSSHAKKMTKMVESLVKYANKLKKINIHFMTMTHATDGVAEVFSEEIDRFT